MTPADIVTQLEQVNGRKDKEDIIHRAWQSGLVEFFKGAQLAYDALVTFGIKQVPESNSCAKAGAYTWSQFSSLAEELQSRKLTGNAAREAVQKAAEQCDAFTWNKWYRRVLIQDLKCGVTATTINTVLGRNGKVGKAWEVPVFSCQLAKSADDHPKKMTGVKLCDVKYDGIRLLTVIHKSGVVQQFTRNGIQNRNFGHICEMLSGLAPDLSEDMVLDGEVISANFQALMTQVNRKAGVNTSDSRLMLFDMIPLKAFRAGEHKVSQADRHKQLCALEPRLATLTNGVVTVEPKIAINLDTPEGQTQLKEFNRKVLAEKLEGIMVKDPNAFYKTKRSDAWLKMKPYETYDLTVISVEPGTVGSKYEHTMGAVIFEGVDNGRKINVSVGSGWSDSDRAAIWTERTNVIGRIAEIKGDVLTLSQDSDTYSLRFPVFVRWRGWEPGVKI